jgi:hypothetical protein
MSSKQKEALMTGKTTAHSTIAIDLDVATALRQVATSKELQIKDLVAECLLAYPEIYEKYIDILRGKGESTIGIKQPRFNPLYKDDLFNPRK